VSSAAVRGFQTLDESKKIRYLHLTEIQIRLTTDNEEFAVATQWFYTRVGQETLGPCTSRTLKQLASTGQILPTDMVRKEGMEKAVRARRVKGLFAPAAGQEKGETP
jgi:hypothetical protein